MHHRFKLIQETLQLTVNIMDRFLMDNEITRGKLQLVGVTAMLIASKYEEMYVFRAVPHPFPFRFCSHPHRLWARQAQQVTHASAFRAQE